MIPNLDLLRDATAIAKRRDLSVEQTEAETHDVLSSGSLALDVLLQTGGLRSGSIVELVGRPSSGKSTLALHMLAHAQQAGWPAALIDDDYKFNVKRAAQLGVHLTELPIITERNTKQVAAFASEMGDAGTKLLVIDSLAGLGDKEELIPLYVQLKYLLNSLMATCTRTGMLVVVTNEIRAGAFHRDVLQRGSRDVSAGSYAIHHTASVRVRLELAEHLAFDSKPTGIRVRATVLKNRWSVGLIPHETTEFDILFSEGVDRYAEVLDAGVTLGLIGVHNNRYVWGEQTAHGRHAALDLLRANPDAWTWLRDQVHLKCFEHTKLSMH